MSDAADNASEIQQLKARLLLAERAQHTFLAKMSHEIRTPMNAIIGMTELALETQLTPEQRDCLDTVKTASHTLLNVINDILDVSKLETGKLRLDPRPCDPRELLHNSIRPLASRAHAKGLELALHIAPEVPDCIEADATRLQQIIVNLVGNAIKFTASGEVVVDVQVASKTAESVQLHLCVRDTGCGIAKDQLSEIFHAFAQADGSLTRKHGGTGLGLTISRRLAEMMKGDIRVESRLGEGSTFHVTLRLGVKPAPAETQLLEGYPDLANLRVLIVDDNATNRFILQESLSRWQIRPTPVEGGPAALEVMKQAANMNKPFDLVLLDGCMPGMDGIAVASAIRQDEKLKKAAILILTSDEQAVPPAKRQELGIIGCLSKPIGPSDLFNAIIAACQTHRPLQEVPKVAASPNRSLRVLLAEDNPINQKLAVRLLEKWGHRVEAVADGLAAVEAVANDSFDMVLMDVQMPEMDGLEASRRIRQAEKATGAHVPIVAVTAHASDQDRDLCLQAGMDDYVPKPIRQDVLLETINRLTAVPVKDDVLPAAAATQQLDHQPASLFKREVVLERLGGDSELLSELIGLFLEACPKQMQEIKDALTAGDGEALSRRAHTIKGSLGSFLAEEARDLAHRIEKAARQGDLQTCQKAWGDLVVEVGRLTSALEQENRGTRVCIS